MLNKVSQYRYYTIVKLQIIRRLKTLKLISVRNGIYNFKTQGLVLLLYLELHYQQLYYDIVTVTSVGQVLF